MHTAGLFSILLADDDPDDRELFTEAATLQNACVQSVANGMELMQALDQFDPLPDFILLDLNMPEKNGKECLQEIRKHTRFNDIPVIIYSTSSSHKDIEDTYAMGANLYITKPNSFSGLKATVKSILEIDWSARLQTQRESFVHMA